MNKSVAGEILSKCGTCGRPSTEHDSDWACPVCPGKPYDGYFHARLTQHDLQSAEAIQAYTLGYRDGTRSFNLPSRERLIEAILDADGNEYLPNEINRGALIRTADAILELLNLLGPNSAFRSRRPES